MIYIKSLLVGVVAFVASAIVYLVVLFSVLLRKYPPPPGTEVALDLGSVMFRPSFWLTVVLAFASVSIGHLEGLLEGDQGHAKSDTDFLWTSDQVRSLLRLHRIPPPCPADICATARIELETFDGIISV